jgi:hypothetical protein
VFCLPIAASAVAIPSCKFIFYWKDSFSCPVPSNSSC